MPYSLTYGVRNRMLWKDRKILKLLLAGFGYVGNILRCDATFFFGVCHYKLYALHYYHAITKHYSTKYHLLIKHWSSLKEE